MTWREKEFVEKYELTRHNDEEYAYSSFEATTENGLPVVIILNADLIKWDDKPSHPWLLEIMIAYDGNNTNGMPNDAIYELLEEIETRLTEKLNLGNGFLNIGRETGGNTRLIYLACKDFRKASKVTDEIAREYRDRIEISYRIYKDKYWTSFNHFSFD